LPVFSKLGDSAVDMLMPLLAYATNWLNNNVKLRRRLFMVKLQALRCASA
jgi:hypothetical protein